MGKVRVCEYVCDRGGGGLKGLSFKITSMPLRSTSFSLASSQVTKEQSMDRLTTVFWDTDFMI